MSASARASSTPSPAAASFAVATTDVAPVARAAGHAAASVRGATAAIVFVAGALGDAIEPLARAVREATGTPALVIAAPGVLGDAGETEQGAAATGLVLKGTTAHVLSAPTGALDESAARLAEQVAERTAPRGGTVLLFARPDRFPAVCLERLARAAPHARVVGGGTSPSGVVAVDAAGQLHAGSLVGLALGAGLRAAIRAAPGARLLGTPQPITETRGPLVLRIGDEPALDALTAATRELRGQPQVIAALAEPDSDLTKDAPLLRGVRGVDPSRRGVFVSEEVRRGLQMAFAVRDGAAARRDLEAQIRAAARELSGAAPRFALLLSCAGRGQALYGARDVEVRALRAQFPGLPVAGMFSSFEIAPHGARSAVHTHTAVLSVFGAPS